MAGRVACFAVVLTALLLAALPARSNIIGPTDDRGTLGQLAEALGLYPSEVAQFRDATGFVVCPGTTHDNDTIASGTLIGGGDVVVTAAHVLIDSFGRPRDPLSECFFQPQSRPGMQVKFRTGIDDIFLGMQGVRRPGVPGDFAVIRLTQPVPGVTPFPAKWVTTADVRTREVIVVSAGQTDWQVEAVSETANDAIVRPCQVMEVGQFGRYFTDCDMRPIGSGGAVFLRRDGEFVPVAIVSSTGRAIMDGRLYNAVNGNSTVAIILSREFVDVIEAMAKGEPLPNGNRYLKCADVPAGGVAACAPD